MMMIRRLQTVVWLLLLVGCDINGTSLAHPGASIYQAPDEGFHFHYLSPPWRTASGEAQLLVKLVVDAYGEFSPSDDKLSHILRISYGATSSPFEEARLARDAAMAKGHVSPEVPAALVSLTGQAGWQFFSHQETPDDRNYFRECFYLDALGRVVRLALAGAFPMDEQNVEDLVLSYSSGPDDGTATPPPISLLPGSSPQGDLLALRVAPLRSPRRPAQEPPQR